ncbi:MAG: hypothetical protein WBA43_05925 [Elainellaceae cyanobacterium]
MNVGDTFLLPTPPNGNHFFFAIATTPEGNYLCVNATTLKPTSDQACILRPGANAPRFIKRDSAIAYSRAREISPTVYARLVATRQCVPKGTCSPQILGQIQQGALASRQIKKRHKQIVRDFLKP